MNSAADSGPNLLLDWQASPVPNRWLPAGVGSLAVHILLFVFAFALSRLDSYTPRKAPEIIADLEKSTPLVAPPLRELTQKAPNRGKIAKEVNVEDLQPRPASQERLAPAPATRRFTPPTVREPQPEVPRFTEPPKLEAANNNPPNVVLPPIGVPKAPPPQIQAQENPKLAFETPGQNGTNPDRTQAKLAPPKNTVDEAIRRAVRGDTPGSVVVGDVDEPPSLDSLRSPSAPGRIGSSLELLSDPQGIDFKPYLIRILALVRQNWFAIIPESARTLGNRGIVQLQFIIDRSGQVPKLVIASPSGSQALDKAAVAGISASVPFPPLPSEFKGQQIRLQFAFKYNVK